MSNIGRALVMTAFSGAMTVGLFSTPEVSAQGASLNANAQPSEAAPAAEVSPQGQLAASENLVGRAKRALERITRMLEQARRDADIIRATCLNDKLMQVDANAKIANSRLAALRTAMSQGDDARRKHEYTVLTVVGQKLVVLEQEAGQCVGQDMYELGVADVSMTSDLAASPNVDPSMAPAIPPPAVPTIPPPASGTF